jgi:hypothetical protein
MEAMMKANGVTQLHGSILELPPPDSHTSQMVHEAAGPVLADYIKKHYQ